MARNGARVSALSRSAYQGDVAEAEVLGTGRIAKPIKIGEVRELTQAELGKLKEKRDRTIVQRFRDSHHKLAWLAATGMRRSQIAAATGYSINRLNVLMADPAFRELVEQKRGKVEENRAEVLDDFEELIKGNMIKAERMLADKLDDADEAEELLPTRELIAISRDAADRLGYGKKATNVNINVDFAAKLDRAMARSGRTINAIAAPIEPPRSLPRGPAPRLAASPAEQAQPIRRRRVA